MNRFCTREIKYNPLAFLNVFRFVGALIIAVVFHRLFVELNDNFVVYTFFRQNGRLFVEMFFLISGMMFCHVYYPKLIRENYTKKFVVKRAIAFYPMIIFTNIFAYLYSFILLKTKNIQPYSLNILNLIMCCLFASLEPIKSFSLVGPLWYINVLFIAYFIAVILVSNQNKKKWIYTIPIFVGVSMYVLYKNNYSFVFWSGGLTRGLISFFLGFYLMIFLNKINKYTAKTKLWIKTISALICLVFVLLLISKDILNQSRKTYWDLTLSFGIVFFPALFCLCYDVKWLNKICSHQIITYLGELSLGIYIFNELIHRIFIDSGMISWAIKIGGWFILIDIIIHLLISIIFEFIHKKNKEYLLLKFLHE